MQASFWHCDNCLRTIWDGEARYNCTVCDDFDFCERCAESKTSPHPHPMARELAYGPVDITESVPLNMTDGIQKAFELYRNREFMGVRDVDPTNPSLYLNSYSWSRYDTIGNRTKNFGQGLRTLIELRSYVGICSANRPEWAITDLACMIYGLISVPMYCLFTDQEMTYIINNTQISVIVCDKQMLSKFIKIANECSSLRHIVCMDSICEQMEIDETMVTVHSMNDLEQLGTTKQYDEVRIKPDECLCILYTSGSSGFPKGAIISEEAYRATFPIWFTRNIVEQIMLCYRPLAWAASRDGVIRNLLLGGRVAFATGDMNHLMEELTIVRPTSFSGAPSIWNKLYSEYKTALSLIDPKKSKEEQTSERIRIRNGFTKLIPMRCKELTVGSAKTCSAVVDFMTECFPHCRIHESYGITECGSVAFDYNLEEIKYRLESVPEMGYTIDDKPYPRGEIVVKTSQMFSGYINNDEETRASLTEDGYFRTGDIVELRPNLYESVDVHVIDRKKSVFKLSQGQFVSPEHLQGIYMRSPFIEQIYIHGDILASAVSAVVVPNRAYTQAFIVEHNLTNFDMTNPNRIFCDAIRQDLISMAEKESLRTYEIPSIILIDFEPFSCENGLLTSSHKPCRHKLSAFYSERLKAMNTVDQRLKTIIETASGRSLSDNDAQDLLLANGADSLTAVRLSRMIENDLGVPVPISVLFDPTMTLQQLTAIIKDPSLVSTISKSIVSQLLKDSQLELSFSVENVKNTRQAPSMIFITGTTGFVGAFLLAELLTIYPSDCKFICLVRCQTNVDPMDRIRENMHFYQIWKDDYQQRIIPLQGDLTKPSFGLDTLTFNSLANQIDLIYHCGAIVNFVLPYSQLYGANVLGTREIIRLATSTTSRIPIHYISTISVLSKDVRTEISIDEISPDDLHGGYAQSKWVAEKLITAAGKLGLPINIYRLGEICAATNTGACNKNDIYTSLVTSMIKLRCYPENEIHSHFNGLPVDFTSKTIVYLSRIQSDTNGKIYHILNPTSNIAFKDIVDVITHCEIPLANVSLEEWQQKLKIEAKNNSSFETVIDFLINGSFNDECSVSAREFCNAVSSMTFPNLDQSFVRRWIEFIFNHIIHNLLSF